MVGNAVMPGPPGKAHCQKAQDGEVGSWGEWGWGSEVRWEVASVKEGLAGYRARYATAGGLCGDGVVGGGCIRRATHTVRPRQCPDSV